MKLKDSHQPVVKLPSKDRVSIYLIKEELKSRKLFQVLHKVGLDDCLFQPHLDLLILLNVGLYDGTDETFNIYDRIIERRSKKIQADNESITEQAFKVYRELKYEKRKRSSQKR